MTFIDDPIATLAAIAKQFDGVSVDTLHAWRRDGIDDPTAPGGRRRLAALKIGGRWCVTRSAWLEFTEQSRSIVAPPSASKYTDAVAELAALGITINPKAE